MEAGTHEATLGGGQDFAAPIGLSLGYGSHKDYCAAA
jgi:hypothetical protein